MSLFSLLNRKNKNGGLTGISFHEDGIALAHVQRDRASQVVLNVCEFAPLGPDEEYGALLEKLTDQHDLEKIPCVSVMQPEAYTLLHVEAPDVQPEELRAAVRWRIKDLIDFHIDDAIIDVFDIESQRARGGSRMMYVVAARASEIQKQVDLLNDAGLTIEAIDIVELTLRNLTAQMPQDIEGNVLVAFDRSSAVISLTQQATLYMFRRIPVGSDQLRASTGSDVTELLDRVVLEVQRSLDYYESHFTSPPIRHITLAPMEQEVPGMAEYLDKELPIPVSVMDFNGFLDCPDIIPRAVQARCSSAVGAALRMEEHSL